jgi:DNA-binding transcriptional regulator YhcF (GntR family)
MELFLMATPAWRSLSMAARVAYVEVAALYDQSNNGRLALSARQLAERMPISKATAHRALQELAAKGFIVAAKPSGFNLKTGERRATEWRLTRYRCDVTGDIATKAFMGWQPDQVHFAVSPQAHSGLTTEPLKVKNGQKSVVVAFSRDRQAILPNHDGLTTGPLLDSTIGVEANAGVAAAPNAASSQRPLTVETEGLTPLRDIIDLSKLVPNQNWPSSKAA